MQLAHACHIDQGASGQRTVNCAALPLRRPGSSRAAGSLWTSVDNAAVVIRANDALPVRRSKFPDHLDCLKCYRLLYLFEMETVLT